jgi:hypothetical protein
LNLPTTGLQVFRLAAFINVSSLAGAGVARSIGAAWRLPSRLQRCRRIDHRERAYAIKQTCPRSPNLQSFAEGEIQTLKHEVLNAFCVVIERHLDHIRWVSQDWYSHQRGHSGRDHLPPVRDSNDPPVVHPTKRKLVCDNELGGHLKSYGAAA